jgi:hypothetical protein
MEHGDEQDTGHCIIKIEEPFPSQAAPSTDRSEERGSRAALTYADSEHVEVDIHEAEVLVENDPETQISTHRLNRSTAQDLYRELDKVFGDR